MSRTSTVPGDEPRAARVSLTVSDKAIATLVAHHASQTRGVARLQPFVAQAAREALTSAARRATSRFTGQGAETPGVALATGGDTDTAGRPSVDTSAVEVDRGGDGAPVRVTLRLVATCEPPIIDLVASLQEDLMSLLDTEAGVSAEVVVQVVDVEG